MSKEDLVSNILYALEADSGESYVDTKAKYIVESLLPIIESYGNGEAKEEHLLCYRKALRSSKDEFMDWSTERYPKLGYMKKLSTTKHNTSRE